MIIDESSCGNNLLISGRTTLPAYPLHYVLPSSCDDPYPFLCIWEAIPCSEWSDAFLSHC
jgi:hypothetical protein